MRRIVVPEPFIPLLRGVFAVATAALLFACGPGGGNSLATPTPMTGQVKVPGGVTLAKPTLLARVGDFLMPEALALVGMETVGAGVEVRLYAIDGSGAQVGPVLASTPTDDNGQFHITVPSRDAYRPQTPWVLAVGNATDGTLMRRLVDDRVELADVRDVDPASEAAVRLFLQDNDPLDWSRITRAEMDQINALVATAAKTASGLTIDEVADVALQLAIDYGPVQQKLAEVTSSDQNARPVALAGADRRLTTNTLVNVLGGGDDPDGTPLGYQWTIDSAPVGSLVNRTPPSGNEFGFLPDVDGVYRLKLVVTDGIQPSPPDYALYIATTKPVPLTINTNTQSEGRLTSARDQLIYTNTVRDARNNRNYTDVEIQPLLPTGPSGPPLVMYPPGATLPDHVFATSEINPYISANGLVAVYSTDMDPARPGTGGSDFDIVAYDYAHSRSLWVTANTSFEAHPVVECAQPNLCTVVYESDADPAGTQLMAVTLSDFGAGFTVGMPRQLTFGADDRFSPRLTVDGAWVYYQSRGGIVDTNPNDGIDLGGATDLEVFRIRSDGSMGGLAEQLTVNGEDDSGLDIDLNGQNLVVERRSRIWWIDVAAGTEAPVSGSQLLALTPSIAGNALNAVFVAYTLDGTDLFSVEPGGANLTQLTADGTVSDPQVSNTGLYVMFRSAYDGDHDYYLLSR